MHVVVPQSQAFCAREKAYSHCRHALRTNRIARDLCVEYSNDAAEKKKLQTYVLPFTVKVVYYQ